MCLDYSSKESRAGDENTGEPNSSTKSRIREFLIYKKSHLHLIAIVLFCSLVLFIRSTLLLCFFPFFLSLIFIPVDTGTGKQARRDRIRGI